MIKISNYIVEPLSRKNIRDISNQLRKDFGLENELEFPIVNLMEILSNYGEFNLEICTSEEMKGKFGETFSSEELVKLREDIYDKACTGDGFSRSTFAHELFHLICHREDRVSFCRREEDLEKRKAYEDPEWQANCFAGELLVPKHLVRGMSVEEVMQKCKVTNAMASYQLRKYENEGWDN